MGATLLKSDFLLCRYSWIPPHRRPDLDHHHQQLVVKQEEISKEEFLRSSLSQSQLFRKQNF